MNIVIASGKGGTGKTTVAINLAFYLAQDCQQKVQLLDCDVEAPNDNLFLRRKFSQVQEVTIPRPKWNEQNCSACGKCVSVCNYNAIAQVKNKIMIFDELCHSCGACTYLCPKQALSETPKVIGKIEQDSEHSPFAFAQGTLKIGESLAPMVIKKLKEQMKDDAINLIDASPGTTCPVVQAMDKMDYCLLVTEPTPFGLNDLTLAASLAERLKLPTSIVINRSMGTDQLIEQFAQKSNIPIIGRIPFKKEYAKSYSQGDILLEKHPELKTIFAQLYQNLLTQSAIPKVEQLEEIDIQADLPPGTTLMTSLEKEIVIISGKGGTGKTTVSSSLGELMKNKILADNDVDASNLHLLCHAKIIESGNFSGGKTYWINSANCLQCGSCAVQCRFGAIKFSDQYYIDEISCEGCGLCAHLCGPKAISSKDAITGRWYTSQTDLGHLAHAKLKVGEENSGKLVSFVRDKAHSLAEKYGAQRILSDGPPGTGCPVISSITGVDLALVVTEPTLSGIHDMERALGLCQHFNIKTLIVVNKYDLNDSLTQQIIARHPNKVIGKIPFDKKVHDALMKGKSIICDGQGDAYEAIIGLWENLQKELK